MTNKLYFKGDVTGDWLYTDVPEEYSKTPQTMHRYAVQYALEYSLCNPDEVETYLHSNAKIVQSSTFPASARGITLR